MFYHLPIYIEFICRGLLTIFFEKYLKNQVYSREKILSFLASSALISKSISASF